MAQKKNQTSAGDKGGNGTGTPGQEDQNLQDLLEADADGDNDADGTDEGNGGGEGGGDGEGEGNGGTDIASIVRNTLRELLPEIQSETNREIDRRVNGALNKVRRPGTKPPAQQSKDEDEGGNDMPGTPVADIRGARMSFREYLPDSIRFLSPEEKALATEYGLNMIGAKALSGFEDEDAVGKEVATKTAEFLKKSRTYYSERTKRALQKQGALKQDASGQQSHGTTPPGSVQSAFDKAEAKMRELGMKVPERK